MLLSRDQENAIVNVRAYVYANNKNELEGRRFS